MNVVSCESHGFIVTFPVFGNRLILQPFVVTAVFDVRIVGARFQCVLMCFDNGSYRRLTCNNGHNCFLLRFERIRILNHSFVIEFIISFQYGLEEPFEDGLTVLVCHIAYLHSNSGDVESSKNVFEHFFLVVEFY